MSSKNWDIFNIFNLNGSNIRLEYWKSKTESKQRGGKTRNKIVENLVCSRTFLIGELNSLMN